MSAVNGTIEREIVSPSSTVGLASIKPLMISTYSETEPSGYK